MKSIAASVILRSNSARSGLRFLPLRGRSGEHEAIRFSICSPPFASGVNARPAATGPSTRACNWYLREPQRHADRKSEDHAEAAEQETADDRPEDTCHSKFCERPHLSNSHRSIARSATSVQQESEDREKTTGICQPNAYPTRTARATSGRYFIASTTIARRRETSTTINIGNTGLVLSEPLPARARHFSRWPGEPPFGRGKSNRRERAALLDSRPTVRRKDARPGE